MNNKGITLIELVMVIVLIGVIVPPLLYLFSQVSWKCIRSEAINQATFYGEQLMEEIKSKRFDENTISPWSSTLGAETGETYPNYDDVDDFSGYSNNPATGYSRTVAVVYLDSSISPGGTWQVLDPQSDTSDYKRITVTVSRDDGVINDLDLVEIVSGY